MRVVASPAAARERAPPAVRPEGALPHGGDVAGAVTLPGAPGSDGRFVCTRPRVAPPCLLRVPD
eukprot:5156402-Prymnesium_polylepis.1